MTSIVSRALIVTALPVEHKAVMRYLSDAKDETHQKGTAYVRARFSSWTTLVAQVGAGNVASAVETERAHEYFEPHITMFVGIAGGLKDVGLGDVVVGTKIYGYEGGADKEHFLPRAEVGLPSYPLMQRSVVVARASKWQAGILPAAAEGSAAPKAFVGPIAAGEKVVKSSRGAVARFLRMTYSDALAVEMEGIGFHRALYANSADGVVVRGISDLLDDKEEADLKGSQEVASAHAAAFAFELLANLSSVPVAPAREKAAWAAVRPDDLDRWQRWGELAPRLYPTGPREREVWSLAGGDLSRLDLLGDGRTQWVRALSILRMGGGGRISALSLLERMGSDFPSNLDLQYVRAEFAE